MSPAALVERARRRVRGIALTDHDTVGGLAEALAAGREKRFPVIPGVELTTDYGQLEVHILAYFIDHHHPGLRSTLTQVVEGRVARAKKIVSNLAGLGYPLTWEAVCAQANGLFVGRPHVMRALLASKLVRRDEADQFFQDYLVAGAPAYVVHEELSTRDAIGLALSAGGVPVLAHPGRAGTDEILSILVSWGLQGIEAFYPTHGPRETARYCRLAKEYRLVCTGGSDFHGDPGGADLGQVTVAATMVEALATLARGPIGQAFLPALHIPSTPRE